MTKAELEARRDEFANDEASLGYEWAVKKLKRTEPSICYEYGVKAGVKLGFDAAATLLQGELDAKIQKLEQYNTRLNERLDELIMSFTNERISLTIQLQSANAKLAVATKDTERLDWMIENQNKLMIDPSGKHFWRTAIVNGRFNSDREAIDAAMDASEGKVEND